MAVLVSTTHVSCFYMDITNQAGVSPCQLGQELHPTSQNSSIFNFYDPISGVRDCVNLFCSILISLEMTAF